MWDLAEGTIDNEAFALGRPYFDGSPWHRVVPGHVIQGGAPAGSQAEGPGYEFPNEICLPELNHDKAGMVNMANAGPHTNGSQWCIMLGDRSYLNGDYTVFGHVIQGLDVVFKITQDDMIETLKIVRVGAAAEACHPTTESFKAQVAAAWERVKREEQEKQRREKALIEQRWPEARFDEQGIGIQIDRAGSGPQPKAGDAVTVRYRGTTLEDQAFVSTGTGDPYWGDQPKEFTYQVGQGQIHAGFDAMVSQMHVGEQRTVIIPASLAYQTNGFYAKQQPGEKRFVISPNTTLVYVIELVALD